MFENSLSGDKNALSSNFLQCFLWLYCLTNSQLILFSAKIGIRHLQVFLLFSCLLVAYSLRVNLSIGIVAMTDNSSNPEFVVKLSRSSRFIQSVK